LPPGTDETIERVLQLELPDVVQGQTGYADSDGVEIWYESMEPQGTPKGTVLLVMGIGNDALAWPGYFIQPMVDAGYRVVRHDHRGTGLSDWMEDWDPAQPYMLEDMAGDGIAVLNALGVDKAHVVGISLGGMIAQQMAISYPGRNVCGQPTTADGGSALRAGRTDHRRTGAVQSADSPGLQSAGITTARCGYYSVRVSL
jgi:pimeloyl-ACP methyl ester carboxylesterase